MNKHNILVKYDKDLRLRILYPEARKEITGDVVRFVRKAPAMNFVSFTFANEHGLDQVIDNELEYFAPMAQPFTWKVYDHDHLPSLKDKLAIRSFIEDDEPADVMVLDIHSAPSDLFQPVKADIRRITERDGLKDVVHVLDAVYGGSNTWVYDRLGMHFGYEFAVVETGDMSRPIVAKHGFQHLTTVWDYQWQGNRQVAEAGVPAAEAVA